MINSYYFIVYVSISFALNAFVEATNDSVPALWVPEYQKADNDYIKLKPKFYYGRDGSCGVYNGNSYVKPNLAFSKGPAKNIVDFHNKNFGPVCGDPDYPYVKHCAMARFFGNNEPFELRMDENDRSTFDMLAFVNGCAVCNVQGEQKIKMDLALKYTLPDGSFFTGCSKMDIDAGRLDDVEMHLTNNARMFPGHGYMPKTYGASFVITGFFWQRRCMGWNSADKILTSYNNVKLVVKHNCDGNGKSFEVALPELVTADHKYHVAEMQGLMLDLQKEKARLFYFDGINNDYMDELKWGNWLESDSEMDSDEKADD